MKKILNFINKYKYIILLILLYTFFFIQMQLIFFYADDYEVLYPLHSNHDFIDVLKFCLEKMNYFWNEWSGRIVGHFVVSFGLSFFGIQFFRILNPIMIFIMIYLILKILKLFKDFDFAKYLFFVSLIVFGLNIYIARETLYWAYSGILYIWGFNLILFTIYFIYKYYLANKQIPFYLLMILCFFSFISTFILEQLSLLLISFLGIMFINSIKKKINYKYLIILLLVTIGGFLISTFAPGNGPRTGPLLIELEGYSFFQIVLGKINGFFNVILNPKIYGIYFSIFIILVSNSYLNNIHKLKLIRKVPLFIAGSYFIIVWIDKLFSNLHILNFYEYLDIIGCMWNISFINILIMIIKVIYYIVLMISIFYMAFKTLWKDYKFLFLSLIVTFFVSMVPVVMIRFIGTRYYIYLFMSLLLISINYILTLRDKSFDLKSLLLFIIILPFRYCSLISVILFLVCIFSKKLRNFMNNRVSLVMFILCFIILIGNIGFTFDGYLRNSKVYNINEKALREAVENQPIKVYEIPYRNCAYSWHSIATNFDGKYIFYGFYLNDFYEDYYGIDAKNIYIIAENGLVIHNN